MNRSIMSVVGWASLALLAFWVSGSFSGWSASASPHSSPTGFSPGRYPGDMGVPPPAPGPEPPSPADGPTGADWLRSWTEVEKARIEAETKARLAESIYDRADAAEQEAWTEADRRASQADAEDLQAAAAERRAQWERAELVRQAEARKQMAADAQARAERRRSLEAAYDRQAQVRLAAGLDDIAERLDRWEEQAAANELDDIERDRRMALRYRKLWLTRHEGDVVVPMLQKSWTRDDERLHFETTLRIGDAAVARAERRRRAEPRLRQLAAERTQTELAAYSRELDEQERQAVVAAQQQLAADAEARAADFERSEAVAFARDRATIAAYSAKRAQARVEAREAERSRVMSWIAGLLGLVSSGVAAARGLARFGAVG